MADPVFQGYSTSITEGASSVSSMAVTTDVTAGDLVLALVQRNSIGSLTGVTIGSQSMTLLKTAIGIDGFGLSVYGCLASSGGTGVSVTASFSDSDQWGSMVALRWSNVASATPTQSACNVSGCSGLTSGSTTRTAQSITTSSRRLVIAVGSDWDNYHTHTGANGFTKRWDTTVASGDQIQFCYDQVANAGSFGGASNFGTTSGGSDSYMSALLSFESTSASPTAVDMTTGTVTVSGHNSDISLSTQIDLGTGSASVSGHAGTIGLGTGIMMGAGTVSVEGFAVTFSAPMEIALSSGSASVVGLPMSVGTGTAITCSTGSISVSGHQQSIALSTTIGMSVGSVLVQGVAALIGAYTTIDMGCGMVYASGHRASVDPQLNYGGIHVFSYKDETERSWRR